MIPEPIHNAHHHTKPKIGLLHQTYLSLKNRVVDRNPFMKNKHINQSIYNDPHGGSQT